MYALQDPVCLWYLWALFISSITRPMQPKDSEDPPLAGFSIHSRTSWVCRKPSNYLANDSISRDPAGKFHLEHCSKWSPLPTTADYLGQEWRHGAGSTTDAKWSKISGLRHKICNFLHGSSRKSRIVRVVMWHKLRGVSLVYHYLWGILSKLGANLSMQKTSFHLLSIPNTVL